MKIKYWALVVAVAGIGLFTRREAGAATNIPKNNRVSVSTSTASPTTIAAADPKAKRTTLVNNNTDYLLVGDLDTTFSNSATTGTFRVPANSSWSPDGPTEPYTGGIKGVSGGSGAINVDIIRVR